MLVVAHRDRAIGQRLTAELADVESRFAAELLSDLPCVNQLVEHIEHYRGKMLRPMLVLVSGLAAAPEGAGDGPLTDAHRVVATVVEMVHMATLVHDDILDDAQVRRRGATVNHLHGNETAVMLGDYLISHAYHLCSSLDQPAISRMIADATNVVCEGELLQLANRNNWQLDEQTYLEIIGRKTASLCGTCCRLGAVLHGDGRDQRNGSARLAAALHHYGEKIGVAFQMIDDLLDLTGSQDTVGKTLGRDLEKGKLTLPLIHYLKTAQPDQRQALLDQLEGVTAGREPDGQRIRELVIAGGSVQYAGDWAARLTSDAKTHLACLPDTPARQLLLDMADAVLTRKF